MESFRDRVTLAIADHIADVKLARPQRMNAIDAGMFSAIAEAINWLETRAATGEVRAVVLSGEGKGFCAGLDKSIFSEITAVAGRPPSLALDLRARTHGDSNIHQFCAMGWQHLPVPVIAAVHGVALGGGLQIALGADLRLIAPGTSCGLLEITWGMVPDMGGMALLPRLLRDDVLRELVFTGRTFTGTEAVALGVATRLESDPYAAAMDLARRLVGFNPAAVRAAKRLANRTLNESSTALLLAESEEQELVLSGPELRELIAALGARRV